MSSPWYYKIEGELIKKQKPCLEGNYIHIKKWDGCYRVHSVNVNNFSIMKNREIVKLPWSEFRCLKGDGIITTEKKLKNLQINLLLSYNLVSDILFNIKNNNKIY
jgi:hypothetical protein